MIAINGGMLPVNEIICQNLQLLNLSNQGLYSEDLFIMSQYLKRNDSITHINLSNNFLGIKFVEPRIINQQKLKPKDLRSSLGLEHFAISLQDTDRLKEFDISGNDIGENFHFL